MSDQLTKHHPDSPNGCDDVVRNTSGNREFGDVLNVRLSRRNLLKGGFGLAAGSFMSFGLSGCLSSGGSGGSSAFTLGFDAVAKGTADALRIPTGYTATYLYRVGDPINAVTGAYANDGTDLAASFEHRAGDHHDGMAYFGLNAAGLAKDLGNNARGLLCMNHENITQIFLHTVAEVGAGFDKAARVPAQIDKEVNAHGVSVIEVVRNTNFSVNKLSGFNRRYTAASPMEISGPAAGDDLMVTPYSTAGSATRGTLNNCANGVTPWGTYLTCEENWAGYFKRPASSSLGAKAATAQNRYIGSGSSNGSYGWANPAGGDTSGTGLYDRWNITPTGADATADYRNAANTMGWVVEIDPFAPAATPRKRTALGRFGHEGAMPAKAVAGKPIVYYMGDDARGEYIYKYVSTAAWNAADADGGLTAGDKYLDDGKLYVATFAADGSGTWTELNIANPLIAGYAGYTFADQADVLINCRLAADAVGATPMDRPEWTGVHPVTGEIYVTLTNNSDRGKTGTTNGGKSRGLDAANPRYYDDGEGNKGNPNGHIVRIRETGDDHAATAFAWDVYLFGAESDQFGNPSINISGLTDDNDFSSPDGLWFSQAVPGLMWLQTDDGAYTDVTNCMMLAALPGKHGDGAAVDVANLAVPSNGGADQTVTTYAGKDAAPATLRRFLVGPKGCEITGITETPDGKAIFVNIQHPGEDTSAADIGTPANYQSHWPEGGSARPRSTTVVITKDNGGLIGA
ncbi:PhoX family phosphatase [Azonexus sp.]|uniref:PhoX family protein n=1 Tax=Azonexus sp. TaxID=1872668 RepID=UPI0035B2CD8E